MGKSAKDVIASISKDKQISGITRIEIMTALAIAGFGVKKQNKRTKELITSAILQSDGSRNEAGEILFWSPHWPWTYKTPIGKKLDAKRICAIYYDDQNDPRHEVPLRVDGRENAWLLE